MTTNLNHKLKRKRVELIDEYTARCLYKEWRAMRGHSPAPLLTQPDGNTKLAKSEAPTYGLSLAAANSSGDYNVCPASTPLCRQGCLTYAGKGGLSSVQTARILRTQFLGECPNAFVTLLNAEIAKVAQKHEGFSARVRLNVLSDLEWELIAPFLFEQRVMFYDYTKIARRLTTQLPSNYRLVFSASELTSDQDVKELLQNGTTVAMVFDRVPQDWHGIEVVSADDSDDRWLEAPGTLLGLKAKGRMRRPEYEGFVRITKR